MKKLIVSLLMVAGVSAALAQGTVTFNTFNSLNTTLGQTFMPDGTSAPGPSFYGQLWWSDTSNGTFAAAGTPQAFDSVNPTYVVDGSVAVPGRDAGTTVWFQMYVWDSAGGANWPGQGIVTWGISAPKSRILGGVDTEGNPFSPQQFNGFANFNLTPVPEPSALALAGLGVASLLIFRRRK